MLRFVVSTSAEAAKKYRRGSFIRGDYYTEDQEIIGSWGGHGAERLGLVGNVETKAYEALCDNLNPITNEQLTARNRRDRRPGFDLTFDVPKSVSVMYAVTGDTRIFDVFRAAVRETMDDLEQKVQTRVRAGGQDRDRTTGNIIWAEYIHQTARPVDGYPDPQLHAHVYVINATFDEAEGKWKALQLTEAVEMVPRFQAAFHSRVAEGLERLGYAVVLKGRAFEIEGVPESVTALFSRRAELIEEVAREQGIIDPKEKAKLGALTREAKNKEFTMSELKEVWRDQLNMAEIRLLEALYERARLSRQPVAPESGQPREHGEAREQPVLPGVRKGVREEPLPYPAPAQPAPVRPEQRAAVEQAIRHCFANKSVVTQSDFEAAVLRFGIADIRLRELHNVLDQTPELVRRRVEDRTLVTTHEIINEEKDLIHWVRSGKGKCRPLAMNHAIVDQRLGEDQRAAVKHILESTDRIVGVEGRAGTGKTTLMKEAINAMTDSDQKVMVLAPTAAVARSLLRQEGFTEANTVEKWLRDEDLQRSVGPGAVWWIDEAGMLSVPQMKRLAELAERMDARIALSGDTRQHHSVERGDALRLLKEHADLDLALVDTVRRQTGTYKEAVEAFSNYQMVEGFEKLDAMGAIVEVAMDELPAKLATKYRELVQAGKNPLIVSPTHLEIRKVTEAVRAEMQAAGELGYQAVFETLRPLHLSPAEKRDVRSFRSGQVLEITEETRGFEIGERITVISAGTDVLHVETEHGRRNFDPAPLAERFDVFQPEKVELAEGDRILITKNTLSVGDREAIYNGTVHKVASINAAGDIIFKDGRVLDKEFKHWTSGYATTDYVSQGKSVDTVLVAESSLSFGGASREQFYVAISRGIQDLTVFTDGREELLDVVHRSSRRTSAVELEPPFEPYNVPQKQHLASRLGTRTIKEPAMQNEREPETVPQLTPLFGEMPTAAYMLNMDDLSALPTIQMEVEPQQPVQQQVEPVPEPEPVQERPVREPAAPESALPELDMEMGW